MEWDTHFLGNDQGESAIDELGLDVLHIGIPGQADAARCKVLRALIPAPQSGLALFYDALVQPLRGPCPTLL
jgi:hypothetical protein